MAKNLYSRSVVLAVLMHALLAALLLISLDKKAIVAHSKPASEPVETIDAVAIDISQLNQEVARLESIEKEKKRKERQRQERLEQKRQETARKAKLEQERLTKLKAEKQRLAEEARKEEERLKVVEEARLKQIQKEKEELEKIKREQELALKKKKEAQEQKRIAELEREKAEKARKEAEEEQRLAQERRKQEEAEAKKREQERQRQLAEEKRRLQQEELARQERARLVTDAQVQQYSSIVASKIHQNWRWPVGMDITGKECDVVVQVSNSGEVLNVRVARSSGDKEFDRSTELAVLKSSPFPMPSDDSARKVFTEGFRFTFKPEGA